MKYLFKIHTLIALFLLLNCNSIYAEYSNKNYYDLPPLRCNRPYKTLQAGIGVQKSLFVEFGIARFKHMYLFGFNPRYSYYAAFEWIPVVEFNKETNIVGLKSGIDICFTPLIFKIEQTSLTNFENNNMLITPRAGIDVGLFQLLYGHNFIIQRNVMKKIGVHQITLIFNLRCKI